MILALQTTTFSEHGGIPAYNRIVCRALNEASNASAISEKQILIGTDRPADVANGAKDLSNLSFEAFSGSRLALMWRALGFALHERIELALIGHVNYAPFGLMLRRSQPLARYAVILYGIESWRPLAPLKRRALCKADFLIAISETTKTAAVTTNELDASRVYVLPNALRWVAEEPATTEPPVEEFRLLSVCRLDQSEQYKGIDNVIKALPEVARRVPDVTYVVVGGGSDLARHKELAEQVGVADRVAFKGFVNEDTLRSYYRACDVFLMPSAAEGFGFVFLEAMHHAKPVIAANSGATPEVVKDGETGMLVEYGNVEQLANAIILLSQDGGLRRQLGTAGQHRLQTNFSFDQFKQRFNDILLREMPVMGRGGDRPIRSYLSRGTTSA